MDTVIHSCELKRIDFVLRNKIVIPVVGLNRIGESEFFKAFMIYEGAFNALVESVTMISDIEAHEVISANNLRKEDILDLNKFSADNTVKLILSKFKDYHFIVNSFKIANIPKSNEIVKQESPVLIFNDSLVSLFY